MRRRDFDRELTDELRDHLERRAADLIKSGLTPDEARRRARVEFGAVEAYKEQIRDAHWWTCIANLPEQIWRELIVALRRLRATPAFALFAMVSLGIGIGVTTAMYSLMYPVLWPAASLHDAHTLVYLTAPRTEVSRGRSWQYTTARGDFNELAAAQQTMSHLAAWTTFHQPLVDGNVRAPVAGEAITGNAFEAAGIRAAHGRLILPADDAPAANAVAVLNHSFWKQRFAGDVSVVGRVIRIGGQPVEVVGIAAAGFSGFGRPLLVGDPALWMTISAAARFPSTRRSAFDPGNHEGMALSVVGRLKPGRSVDDASAEMAAIGLRLDSLYPIPLSTRFWKPQVDGHGGVPRGWQAARVDKAIVSQDPFGWLSSFLLVGLVGLVLAVACANLANLTVARGSARAYELATRRALGSSRWRLVREQAMESVALAGCGWLLGLVIARSILLVSLTFVPIGMDVGIRTTLIPGVLFASGGLMIVTLLVVGVWPAIQLSRQDVRSVLASNAGSGGSIRWRARRHFITAQVAVSAAFFLVAAMFVKSVISQLDIKTGIDLDRVALTSLNFRLHQWDESRGRAALDRVVAAARQEPAFDVVAYSAGMPFGRFGDQAGIATADRPFSPTGQEKDDEWTHTVVASPEIFSVLGVPIVRGRAFDMRDVAGAPPVVVVAEQTARKMFNTSDVVGRQLLTRDDLWTSVDTSGQATPPKTVRSLEIIGVARDTDVGIAGYKDRNLIYLPYAQHYDPVVDIVVRTSGSAAAAAAMLPAIVHRADPDLVTQLTGPAELILNGRVTSMRVLAGVAIGLGAIVLLLAMTGLFGVLSHLVARRTRELGIRMALGATSRDLARLVLGDGLRPVVLGLIIGVVLGTLGRLVFRAMVMGRIEAFDPLAIAFVPIPLVLAGLVASYLPARRASRVDPNVALRNL